MLQYAAVSFFCLLFLLQACGETTLEPIVNSQKARTESAASQTVENSRSLPAMTDQNEQLCQMTLDLPQLEGYFHQLAPNRKPLRVLKNNVVKENIKLIKFGEPVRLVTLAEVEKEELPFFEFTAIEIKKDAATVIFRYPVEGITGTVDFKREADKWKIVSQKIAES